MSDSVVVVPKLCRVEYWTSSGWFAAHAGIALQNPGAYVAGLSKRGIVGRVTELDDQLQPGVVHQSELAELL